MFSKYIISTSSKKYSRFFFICYVSYNLTLCFYRLIRIKFAWRTVSESPCKFLNWWVYYFVCIRKFIEILSYISTPSLLASILVISLELHPNSLLIVILNFFMPSLPFITVYLLFIVNHQYLQKQKSFIFQSHIFRFF